MKKVLSFLLLFYCGAYTFTLYASQQVDSFGSYKNEIRKAIEDLGGDTKGLSGSQSLVVKSTTNPYQEHIRLGMIRSNSSLESEDVQEEEESRDLPHTVIDIDDHGNAVCYEEKDTQKSSSSLKVSSEPIGAHCDLEDELKNTQLRRSKNLADDFSCKKEEITQEPCISSSVDNESVEKEREAVSGNNEPREVATKSTENQQKIAKVYTEKVFCFSGCC